MKKLNKGIILASTLSLSLVLTACNEKTEGNKEDKQSEDKKQAQHNQQNDKEQAKQDNKTNEKSTNDISQNTKLALAFFADDADKYILTKDEALTGIFESDAQGKKEKKQLYKLLLIKEKSVANAPEDMDFYTVYPPKGSFASIVGVSKDKVLVSGTQATPDYKELKETGEEYNVKDLYEKNKDYSSLDELANKIKITDKNPMQDDKTREEYEANESPSTNTHMRTQVFQMIADFDGKIDTDKYLVDNVKLDKNGKWYVNYRNKNAEIVGTYTTMGKDIVKKNAEGKVIKKEAVKD